MEKELALLMIIINNGYGEEAIELLKDLGLRGATILNGTGAVKPEAKKLYGLEINPEKEVILSIRKECSGISEHSFFCPVSAAIGKLYRGIL